MLKLAFIIETILLIILIVAFRAELMTAPARFYLAFKDSPRAEQYIGDFYTYSKTAANKELANLHHAKALESLKTRVNSSPKEELPAVKMTIGRFFECGKATKPDLVEAKRFYEEAIKEDDDKHPEYKDALKRVDDAIQKGGEVPVCVEKDEVYYIQWAN
jgi:TPR repeat protein